MRRAGGSIYEDNWFPGDIGEIIVYKSALSDADRQGVESYLNAKWGLGIANRLAISTDILPPGTAVTIESGAIMDLAAGTNTVRTLRLNGTWERPGTWGSSTSGAVHTNDSFFAGSGVLRVTQSPAVPAMIVR